MTCNLASLSGAMYHGFEGAISTFGVYFPYLNLALKWSNEPGPPQRGARLSGAGWRVLSAQLVALGVSNCQCPPRLRSVAPLPAENPTVAHPTGDS